MEFLKLYDEENRDILFSMSWLNKNSIFDKSIGSFEDIDLFTFLENISSFDYEKDIFYDDIYYILEYTKDNIFHLINNINKEIKREHKIVPISQAKEFDKKTILWLSRQDGRTIKEKLKNNKIKAVKRYKNVDTYENRIFKIFLKKLILVEEKREQIQSNDYLIGKIRQWLRSDDAKSINEYGNIVYNNILLHHPHYSKIFKSYKWLNRLNEKFALYKKIYPRQIIEILTFDVLSKLQFNTDKLVLPNCLSIDYNEFSIEHNENWLPEKIDLLGSVKKLKINTIEDVNFRNIENLVSDIFDKQLKVNINKDRNFVIDASTSTQVFIDLFRLFPIAKIDTEIIDFPITMQQGIKEEIVNANNTKVIDLNHKIYTLPEILKTYDTNILRIFLENFEKHFKDKQLNYIIPDYVNIFEFSSVKKAINSYFPNSRNIPKSILAGLQYLFDGNLQKDDTLIYIQKNHDNDLYITPLLVKYDKSLQSITNGLYLEKHPTKKLKEENDIISELNRYFNDSKLSKKLLDKFLQNGIKGIKKEQIAFYHDNNLVYLKNSKNLSKPKNRISEIKSLFNNKNLFKKEYVEIHDNNENNLNNFEKLLKLEQDGFILWKEHLPRLTMQLNPFKEFVLVDDDSKVENGNIEINNHFLIPANQTELSFPLIFGEENINFEAYITSNDLPLKKPIKCELKLEYNYEDETPYKLTFIAIDNSIKPLKVKWREIKEKEYRNLPYPIYPQKKSWNDFRNFIGNNKTTDLIEWMEKNLNEIIELNKFYLNNSSDIYIYLEDVYLDFFKDRKGFYAAKFSSDYINNIFFHQNNFDNFDENIVDDYLSLSFELIESRNGGYQAINIVIGKELSNKIINSFRKSLRFPLYTIWKDGNSLSDIDVPNNFRILTQQAIEASINILKSKEVDKNLKIEILLFLSCLHKDSPKSIFDILIKFIKDNKIKEYRNHIPYAIGCLETENQQKLFSEIFNLLQSNSINIYLNALEMLGIIFWRCEDVIFSVPNQDILAISKKLESSLNQQIHKNIFIRENQVIPTLILNFELLFALLRYRKIDDTFLSPNDKITKDFIKIIDKIIDITLNKKIEFKSRIQIDIQKEEEFIDIPDLLYALKIYLSGDTNVANSIKVLGVSDD